MASSVAARRPEAGYQASVVVEKQLAEAVSRIRVHDVLAGTLLLAVWTAAYALVMIVVDRLVVLPDWVRQVSWAGFVLVSGLLVWWKLIQPVRLRINPLYAAAQVEKTLEDPKNLLTAYVDVKERGVAPPAVEAALSVRAAQLARVADVNHAVDHRGLLYLGLVLGVLLVALAALFFWWRATQFTSLLRRTFMPFTPQSIATRTQITLLQPAEGDATITQGQTFTVRVHLSGRIPPASGEDRPRLLLRYTQEEPSYEEVPLQLGEHARDWQGKVPDYLAQTGFWYKVAAGDAETPEYRVNVRTLPLFTDFEVRYEYPAYMNRPADRASGPYLRAYRGTRITLLARTNREPTRGTLLFESPQLEAVPAQQVPGLPDALRFTFVAREAGRYRLRMDTSAGETGVESPWFLLALDPDLPPTVTLTQPVEPEIVLPANGTMVVDGQVGDDFGIDRVRLRFRYKDRTLQAVPYMNGRSFRRERDNTWPSHLTFKLSVDLRQLRAADNAPFSLTEGMVLEYWAEAIDNCNEAPPVADWDEQRGQVGRSEIRRLRLVAPLTQEQLQQQEQQRKSRQQEEQHHDQQQLQRLEAEDRTPQAGQHQAQEEGRGRQPEGQPQPKEAKPQANEGQPQQKDGKLSNQGQSQDTPSAKEGQARPMGDQPQPKGTQPKEGQPQQAEPQAQNKNSQPKDGQTQAGQSQPQEGQPQSGQGNAQPQRGQPQEGSSSIGQSQQSPDKSQEPRSRSSAGASGEQQAPMPKTPEQRQLEQQAQRVREELERQKQEWERHRTQGGEGKPAASNGNPPTAEPGQLKPPPSQKSVDPSRGSPDSIAKPDLAKGGTPPAETRPQPQAQTDPGRKTDAMPVQLAEDRPPPASTQAQEAAPAPKSDTGAFPKPKAANERPNTDLSQNPAKGGSGAVASKEPPSDNQVNSASPHQFEPKNPLKGNQTPQDKIDPKGSPFAKGSAPLNKQPRGDDDKGAKASNKGENVPADAKQPSSQATGSGLTPQQRRELEQAVEDLASGDQQRQQAARDKLDKALGQAARQAIENELQQRQAEWEQLQKDLASSDPARRAAAQKRLEELRREAERHRDRSANQGKEDNTASGGKQSKDPLRKEADGFTQSPIGPKGSSDTVPKFSPEELKALAEKAQDLVSPDEQKRRQAEQALDDKLGREARQRLQEQLQQQMKESSADDPQTQAARQKELQQKVEELARQLKPQQSGTEPGLSRGRIDLDKYLPRGGDQADPPLPEMDADPRHRARTAALQLQEFERHRSNEDLLRRLGWTAEEYERFLEAQRQYVEQLQREAQSYEERLPKSPAASPTTPTIRAGGAGKVEYRPGATAGTGSVGGAAVAPPGFENASERFFEELRKRQKK